MPVATQKTDTGLTMGLLKILHKQVNNLLSNGNISIKFDSILAFSKRNIIIERNSRKIRSFKYPTRTIR
jgi:hypothetical protein